MKVGIGVTVGGIVGIELDGRLQGFLASISEAAHSKGVGASFKVQGEAGAYSLAGKQELWYCTALTVRY